MSKTPVKPALWTPRPVEETIEIYDDWADSYDADLAKRVYHTPRRIAEALTEHVDADTLILDYGCGTGVSGAALKLAGFDRLHGTDISEGMLEQAKPKALYEKLWLSGPDDLLPEPYPVIVAAGVVSLGAAPPETLDLLTAGLAPGGLLALSYNDPTLADPSYEAALQRQLDAGLRLISRTHGPHIDDVNMGSDVILLAK